MRQTSVNRLDSGFGSGIGSRGGDTIGGISLNIFLGLGRRGSSWDARVGIGDVDAKALKVNIAETPDEDGAKDGCRGSPISLSGRTCEDLQAYAW